MNRFKKLMKKIKNPEEIKKLEQWRARLEKARMAYAGELDRMTLRNEYYEGTREVQANPNTGVQPKKVSSNVRNIVYELLETEVDSSIPQPKITPIHKEDEELAKIIEAALINEVKNLRLQILNDEQERTVLVQGADFFHVEWDNRKGTHCTIGDVEVSSRHPRQVIPQPGVTDINKMDYIFVLTAQTKRFVKLRYGVDVEDAEEERPEIRDGETGTRLAEDMVTVCMAYYRNDNGGIGLYTWCDDYELEDLDDYQARRLKHCKKCGAIVFGDKCPECGSTDIIEEAVEEEELTEEITLSSGEILTPGEDEIVTEVDPMTGQEIPVGMKVHVDSIPYYKPKQYPLVVRKNVTKRGSVTGRSDVDLIIDQQDMVKKLGTKIDEKLLKGGSYLSLPKGLQAKTDGNELNIIRVENPSQASMISVYTVQADTSQDRIRLAECYEHARSTLGITDAYQGKYDASATSGTAKQYSINQAAGRLESKRVMKNVAYSQLYELIFKFWLAYADQPIPISSVGSNGETQFAHFNRYDFLKRDAAGELYWNDEFLFETDPTSSIMTNREAMWQQADMKLQSGAFGQLGDLQTLQLYWMYQEANNYPNAAEIRKQVELRIQQQQEQAQMMAQMQGGATDEMPEM